MYTYRCKIVRVVDGDTLDLEIDLGFNVRIRERVRLFGVNTPEVFGTNATEAGKLASEFTKTWVEKYSNLVGHFEYHSLKYDAKDKYGRGLGIVKFIGSDNQIYALTEDLVKNGHSK